MEKDGTLSTMKLLTLILTREQCACLSRMIRKEHVCVTKLMSHGTVNSHFLQMLGITSSRREMVMMLMTDESLSSVFPKIRTKLQLDKPGHGIAYVRKISAFSGISGVEAISPAIPDIDSIGGNMYSKITVIVDRGNAEKVMDIAREAGARGGTILHGRGSVSEQDAERIFGIEIEPEKELIIILTPVSVTRAVFEAVAEKLSIGTRGNGIMYVENVNETYGLYEQDNK